mmetsp:Transcript_64179/g.178307  ORF Transcript_64179/g.178307 Transcript_64179/m.178307 type:complete len:147 (+) Transcript_64179:95-535(+)
MARRGTVVLVVLGCALAALYCPSAFTPALAGEHSAPQPFRQSAQLVGGAAIGAGESVVGAQNSDAGSWTFVLAVAAAISLLVGIGTAPQAAFAEEQPSAAKVKPVAASKVLSPAEAKAARIAKWRALGADYDKTMYNKDGTLKNGM